MATIEWDHVNAEDPVRRLEKLADFLKKHDDCPDEIVAALDIVPDVIRLDCLICSANVQVRYGE